RARRRSKAARRTYPARPRRASGDPQRARATRRLGAGKHVGRGMARKRRRRSAASNRSSGLPFLGVGLALGLAVAAGVYFSDLRSGAGLPRPPDSRTAAPPAASSAEREHERSSAAALP